MAGPLILMALGPYVFSVSTASYQRLRRATEWRWAAVERIGRRPALQFVGAGSESVTLSGTVHPHVKGGLRQLDLMRLVAGLGQPLILVDGMGISFGRWCITDIGERQSALMVGGAPREQQFDLTIRRYGEDLI